MHVFSSRKKLKQFLMVHRSDGLTKVWRRVKSAIQCGIRSQQGGAYFLFSTSTIDKALSGSLRVPENVKLASKAYTQFLDKFLALWLDVAKST